MRLLILVCIVLCAGCNARSDAENDLGINWVDHSAEFEALALQTYTEAESDLAGYIEDSSFTAVPGVEVSADMPVAVILDVDETVVSNVGFQATFERPFENWKLDKWNRENTARPIPGVKKFVEAARAAGVTVFFVTNRPCEEEDGQACPRKTPPAGHSRGRHRNRL